MKGSEDAFALAPLAVQRVARCVAVGMDAATAAAHLGLRISTVKGYFRHPQFDDAVSVATSRKGRDRLRRAYPALISQLLNLAGIEEQKDGSFVVDLEPRDRKTAASAISTLLAHTTAAGIGAEAPEQSSAIAAAAERAVGAVAISCAIMPVRPPPAVIADEDFGARDAEDCS